MHKLHQSGRAARRVACVFAFMLILVVTANAYTVVMRGGRRIEIPSRFVVTPSTLTYETAPGMQITLQMTAIDIPATEKANNELPGSLLRRSQLPPEPASSAQSPGKDAPASAARRTITNKDLESAMRRRRESELAYDNRLKQLGLPSLAESRRQAEIESEAAQKELEQRRVVEQQTESYWRGRAEALRTEMAAMDAEIAWIRARLDEGPFPLSNAWGSSSVITTGIVPFLSFGNVGRRSFGNFGGGGFPRTGAGRPGVFVAPRQGAQVTGRVPFGGGATRGRVFINPGTFPHSGPRGMGRGFPAVAGVGVFGAAVPSYDYSYERSELITHFNALAAARAGLNARWRELEEEARRAGAPPGWLRP